MDSKSIGCNHCGRCISLPEQDVIYDKENRAFCSSTCKVVWTKRAFPFLGSSCHRCGEEFKDDGLEQSAICQTFYHEKCGNRTKAYDIMAKTFEKFLMNNLMWYGARSLDPDYLTELQHDLADIEREIPGTFHDSHLLQLLPKFKRSCKNCLFLKDRVDFGYCSRRESFCFSKVIEKPETTWCEYFQVRDFSEKKNGPS